MGLEAQLKKIPGGPRVQAFVGTAAILGLCAIPVFAKDDRPGHDLFSQEKPEAVLESQEQLQKDFRNRKRNQQ